MPRSRLPAAAGVALLAAACFWPSIRLGLEWVDQGDIVYPTWLAAHGALPFRDFHHLYGPSPFFLNGALLRWFGEDLLVLRLGLLLVKIALAVLVFLLSCRVARPAIAFLATAWFVVIWSSPLWLFTTPYAVHYTLVLSLAGVALLVGGPRPVPRVFAAGLCFGIAATFKQTAGLLGAVGVTVALASSGGYGGERDVPARLLRIAIALVVLLLVLAYPARARGTWTMAILVAPPAVALVARVMRNRTALVRIGSIIALGLGFVVPLAILAAFYAGHGALRDLVHDTLIGLPQRIDWYVPIEAPAPRTGVLAAAIAAGAAALAVPAGRARTVVLGLATVAVAGVVGAVFTRPGWGVVSWQLSIYLPAVLVWTAAVPALRANDDAQLLWWYGALSVVSLYPSADLPHALMILPAVIPLLALLLERLWTAAGACLLPRLLTAGLAGLPLLMPAEQALAFLEHSEATRPPGAETFARASGIWDGAPTSSEMRDVLAVLDRTAPPHAPVLVLPSAQLLYFLADRPSPVPRAELVLYLLTAGLLHPDDARALASEDDMLALLRAAPPLVVRTDGDGWRRIAIAFPALARWIDSSYAPVARVGPHEVLRPREAAVPSGG